MICRRCRKQVPDRLFGYCKGCAEELGAVTCKDMLGEPNECKDELPNFPNQTNGSQNKEE